MTDLITQVAKLISVGRSGGVPDRETAGRIVEMVLGADQVMDDRMDVTLRTKDVERLARFAEMMLGQLKSASASAEAVMLCQKAAGAEQMQYKVSAQQFARLIEIGEDALEPFRSELRPI